jgi:hypothetical protein
MVEATIEAAESGQYAAMRCLFDLAGLFSTGEDGNGKESATLAKTLLDRLGVLEEGPAVENEVTKDSGVSGNRAAEHTVK